MRMRMRRGREEFQHWSRVSIVGSHCGELPNSFESLQKGIVTVLVGRLKVGLDNGSSPDCVDAVKGASVQRTVSVALVKRYEQCCFLVCEESAVENARNDL